MEKVVILHKFTTADTMKIGIIVAMEKEFVELRTLLDNASAERHNNKDFIIGNIENNLIIMQQCGIGKVNSAIGAVELINNYHPDIIISTGVAGGADVTLNVTDVVVGTSYVYHDAYCGSECAPGQIMGMPEKFNAPKQFVDIATSIEGETNIKPGLIVSGEWFVDSREKMQSILDVFPEAVAVDMESCSIAQTCHIYGVPFISFRIISDIPLKGNNASQYFDFWARMAEGSFNVTKKFLASL